MPPVRGRKARAIHAAGSGQRPNTLGVGERELGVLLDRLDTDVSGASSPNRLHARWPFRHASLGLTLERNGGARVTLRVACRNLSCGGMSLLHNAYIHQGTSCVIELPRLSGGAERVRGQIVRCVHLTGVAHEAGLRFDEPIRMADFVDLDPMMGWSSFERVDPERLTGVVLVMIGAEAEQKVVSHFLSDTNLKLRWIASAEEIDGLGERPADVALIDTDAEGWAEAALRITERGAALSIVGLGSDTSASARAQLRSAGLRGFLFRPLSNERLLRVLAECMLADDAVRIDPALAGEAAGSLIAGCVDVLHACASELREAIVADDAMRCFAICQHVKAVAGPAGLGAVSRLAERAIGAVAQSMSVEESTAVLQDLVRVCERAGSGSVKLVGDRDGEAA